MKFLFKTTPLHLMDLKVVYDQQHVNSFLHVRSHITCKKKNILTSSVITSQSHELCNEMMLNHVTEENVQPNFKLIKSSLHSPENQHRNQKKSQTKFRCQILPLLPLPIFQENPFCRMIYIRSVVVE